MSEMPNTWKHHEHIVDEVEERETDYVLRWGSRLILCTKAEAAGVVPSEGDAADVWIDGTNTVRALSLNGRLVFRRGDEA